MTAIDLFIDKYLVALRDETAAVFAGAGLSIPAGFVDWSTLMSSIAAEINLSVDKEHDLISVAQFHENERGGRHGINQALVDEFAERANPSENHRLLAALPIRTFWTTNYDTLLESTLRAARKRPDVKITEANLAVTLPRRDAVVYKMHGDISQPDAAVITRDDYEAYARKHPLFTVAFQGDLISKTFLFLGFSFSDPNLNYLFSSVRQHLGSNRRDHYCLMRRVSRADHASDVDYGYACGRQDLQIRDLRRYGIHVLLVDEYSEITDILTAIEIRYRQNRVFVSGSAASYEPWNADQARDFVRLLGRGLVSSGFDVVTGFGLGVGEYLLNGVLEGIEGDGTDALHDRLTIRPFPQGIGDPDVRAREWTRYRQDLLARAGFALFVFGNRTNARGELEAAAGVLEEFDLSIASGAVAIPIGATGSLASTLHNRLRESPYWSERPALAGQFRSLNEMVDAEELVRRVLNLLSTIKSGV